MCDRGANIPGKSAQMRPETILYSAQPTQVLKLIFFLSGPISEPIRIRVHNLSFKLEPNLGIPPEHSFEATNSEENLRPKALGPIKAYQAHVRPFTRAASDSDAAALSLATSPCRQNFRRHVPIGQWSGPRPRRRGARRGGGRRSEANLSPGLIGFSSFVLTSRCRPAEFRRLSAHPRYQKFPPIRPL